MKIRRFVAPDMRQAIAAVRKEIGEDAVILSNKSIDGGVELVAAIDFDEQAFNNQQEQSQTATTKPATAAIQGTPETSYVDQAAGFREAAAQTQTTQESPDSMEAMRREMQALRRMVENELSGISWQQMGDQNPESKELFRQLINMGLSADIAERMMQSVAGSGDFEQQWQKAMFYLSSELAVTGDDLVEHGGIVAVVGPTGVGKTTSIAKLAARYCLKHGNRHVALVSTDNYRIGAREQLHTYGRILNVPVRTAGSAEELNETLNVFAEKRLILIDTAGMSHQDIRLSEQLAMLEVAGRRVSRYLALSATTDLAALKRAIQAFGTVRPDACLLTKTDEAASMGGALSAIIHSGLPLAYYTDGQRVPEDMHVARAHPLVNLASSLAKETSEQQGDGYLAFALSGARTHAYL